jgi:hypothetical protein
MPKIIRALLFAVVGAIVCGAAVFGGGFLLAAVLGKDAQQALGMIVPMVLTPLAIVIGGILGFLKGYRSA